MQQYHLRFKMTSQYSTGEFFWQYTDITANSEREAAQECRAQYPDAIGALILRYTSPVPAANEQEMEGVA